MLVWSMVRVQLEHSSSPTPTSGRPALRVAVMVASSCACGPSKRTVPSLLLRRICAELGAQMVKTYYCPEDFETVTASCPVPIVMAGGKKLPELEALTMAWNAIQQGAAGVDMGRNIFQSEAPEAMMQAVAGVPIL